MGTGRQGWWLALCLGALALACNQGQHGNAGGDAGAGSGANAAAAGQPAGTPEGEKPIGAGSGLTPVAADAGSVPACGIRSRTRLPASAGVVVEQITYRSGDLNVNGVIVRPDDARAHPVILFAHGGFTGFGTPAWNGPPGSCSMCDLFKALAASGFAVAASSYRGEDGSDGHVEVCQGEVDDVAALRCSVTGQPWADGRFAAYGVSHGACITLRLAERDAALQAAVAFVSPADWATLYTGWQQQLAQRTPECLADTARGLSASACASTYVHLSSEISAGIGGTPATQPDAYAVRSPIHGLPLRAPALLFYGTRDYIVDLNQACAARRALAGRAEPFQAWYIDQTGKPVVDPGSPPACGGGFDSNAPPSGAGPWPAGTSLYLLEGEDHDLLASPIGVPGHLARTAAFQFLMARMPP